MCLHSCLRSRKSMHCARTGPFSDDDQTPIQILRSTSYVSSAKSYEMLVTSYTSSAKSYEMLVTSYTSSVQSSEMLVTHAGQPGGRRARAQD
jgi:hypothetical protein